MRKLFYILVLLTGIANAQIVSIPDPNFKSRLIADGIDTNSDGEIQESEASVVTSLNVGYSNISDLTGISSFTNLTVLDCRFNTIANLDITALANLQYLNIRDNNMTSLNVAGLTNLIDFNFVNNTFNNLDLSSFTGLTSVNLGSVTNTLNLSNTNIGTLVGPGMTAGTLNLSNCSNLNTVILDGCEISNVILTGCTALTNIQMESCHLLALDVSTLTNLQILSCSFNLFATLDVSNNLNLTDLICSSNTLQYLFAKNGQNETNMFYTIHGCPNLLYACVDESQLSGLIPDSRANPQISSYCTFTPGGNYNTITGTMTFDASNDGCDVSDLPRSNVRVNISDGTNSGAGYSNNGGNYIFYTQGGSFTLTPNIENPTWFTFSPPAAAISFANNNNNTTTQNFCITANGVHPDLEVVIVPIVWARPGFDAEYKLVYKNKGNQTLSGTVTFGYNDAVLDFVSSTEVPNSQSTGLVSYNYTNLLPFETRSFYIILNVNAPTELPAVNIGDQLGFTATVNPLSGDENPLDNTFQFNQTVFGSFDPNDITCLEGDIVSPTEIGKYLHYNIRFENTGTAAAENIVVKTVVSPADFDIATMELINASHLVDARITGNTVEFIFTNINLTPNQHGNVLLKMKTKSNLLVGDEVNSQASIYFDYNFPVITNDAETVFQLLSNPDFDVDKSISVYPNPTKRNVTISCYNTIHSVQLYDVQGRLLQTSLINENQTILDISSQSNGIYFVKVISDKGILVQKIVKE